MIELFIEESLKNISLVPYYLYRPSEIQNCIVYSYTYKSALESDNEVKAWEYSVLLNVFVDEQQDISAVRDAVIKAMQSNGFKLQPVPTPQRDKSLINIALRFKIIR